MRWGKWYDHPENQRVFPEVMAAQQAAGVIWCVCGCGRYGVKGGCPWWHGGQLEPTQTCPDCETPQDEHLRTWRLETEPPARVYRLDAEAWLESYMIENCGSRGGAGRLDYSDDTGCDEPYPTHYRRGR